MQIDCDYYTDRGNFTVNPGEQEESGKPVIRLFGVNAVGNSVCAHIHNFTAYFYVHVVEREATMTAEELEEFRL